MELWIRSQDKKDLIKITNICMTKEEYGEIGIFANGCIVGLYKSKERALEVLDEIQNILMPKYLLDGQSIKPNGDCWFENGVVYQKYSANASIQEISTYVYEMPQY